MQKKPLKLGNNGGGGDGRALEGFSKKPNPPQKPLQKPLKVGGAGGGVFGRGFRRKRKTPPRKRQ
jgi:hypothetical protein